MSLRITKVLSDCGWQVKVIGDTFMLTAVDTTVRENDNKQVETEENQERNIQLKLNTVWKNCDGEMKFLNTFL